MSKEDLPLVITTGAALDGAFPKGEDAYAAGGVEYKMPLSSDWSAAGRLGYNTGTAGDVSGLTGVTFGLGISGGSLGFDYALVPQGDLGMTHWRALVYRE